MRTREGKRQHRWKEDLFNKISGGRGMMMREECQACRYALLWFMRSLGSVLKLSESSSFKVVINSTFITLISRPSLYLPCHHLRVDKVVLLLAQQAEAGDLTLQMLTSCRERVYHLRELKWYTLLLFLLISWDLKRDDTCQTPGREALADRYNQPDNPLGFQLNI